MSVPAGTLSAKKDSIAALAGEQRGEPDAICHLSCSSSVRGPGTGSGSVIQGG
jgi:hypothetical protein